MMLATLKVSGSVIKGVRVLSEVAQGQVRKAGGAEYSTSETATALKAAALREPETSSYKAAPKKLPSSSYSMTS